MEAPGIELLSRRPGQAMLTLLRAHVEEMSAHACETSPAECCGLLGGTRDGRAQSVYRMRNIACDPLSAYEAALEDLLAAQKLMRERDEQLLGIYHSHPRSRDPLPSSTDVRLAYYPEAIYFIIGSSERGPLVRAFMIDERAGSWEQVEYDVADEGAEEANISRLRFVDKVCHGREEE